MSADHDLPEEVIRKWMREFEDKVTLLQELNANELVEERKRSAATFSDRQTDRIEEHITRAILAFAGSDLFAERVAKEVKFIAGAQALRFWVYVVGSFAAGAISVAIGYWLKTH
jgi:transposase-like protein